MQVLLAEVTERRREKRGVGEFRDIARGVGQRVLTTAHSTQHSRTRTCDCSRVRGPLVPVCPMKVPAPYSYDGAGSWREGGGGEGEG